MTPDAQLFLTSYSVSSVLTAHGFALVCKDAWLFMRGYGLL